MSPYKLSDTELEKMLDIARFAPSVHNTQPWRVYNQQGAMVVEIDPKYKLDPGDPTGRQTTISLGIFTEAISIAGSIYGLSSSVKFEKDKVNISFQKSTKSDENIVKLIKSRATDRSVYKKMIVDPKVRTALEKLAKGKSVKIWLIEDEGFIKTMAKFTGQGINLALSNPLFKDELRRYLVRQGSRRKRGISVRSLYLPSLIAFFQPEILRFGFSTGNEAKLERKRWLSASAVVLITTEGDLYDDWFEAGRTYLRISLELENLGFSQATSAATVEAATFHEDIEKLLGTNQRLQATIRIGKGSSKRHYSPRVSVSELIT